MEYNELSMKQYKLDSLLVTVIICRANYAIEEFKVLGKTFSIVIEIDFKSYD